MEAKLAAERAKKTTKGKTTPSGSRTALRPCRHGCDGPCVAAQRYELVWHGKPLSTNKDLKGGLRDRMRGEKGIHVVAKQLVEASDIPTLASVFMEFQHVVPDRRVRDWDGLTLWVKAFQDGLKHAGLLTDDRGGIVRGGVIHEPRYVKGEERVEITLWANMGVPALQFGDDARA